MRNAGKPEAVRTGTLMVRSMGQPAVSKDEGDPFSLIMFGALLHRDAMLRIAHQDDVVCFAFTNGSRRCEANFN